MSFIPGYQYDIFICSAQFENTSETGTANSWIGHFCKSLELILSRHIGHLDTIRIRTGNTISVEPDIQASAIMICINEKDFAASATCQKEVKLFYQKAKSEKTGLKAGGQSRMLNILLDDIPANKWPEELQNSVSINFYDEKMNDAIGRTLEPGSAGYKSQMQLLGKIMWKLMNDMVKDLEEAVPYSQKKSGENKNAFAIYMAEVSDSLRTSRKRIIAELIARGYEVLTGTPPPDESSAHEKTVHETLIKADASVHLLDEIPGREIPGEPLNWYPKKQAEISFSIGKPQMIWMPEETNLDKVEEEKYKSFLQSIEKGNLSGKSYEFIRGPKCTLTQDIVDFAEHARVIQTNPKPAGQKMSVMLDTHYSDQQYAIDLGKLLLENHIQSYINPQEDDPKKNMKLMGERLSKVNKLIFLYGNVSKDWVRERMSASLEFIISNNYPIEDFYIFMVPPAKEPNNIFIDQRYLNVSVIDNSKHAGMSKAELQYFLKALNTSRE
jgi:hypothetical protein